jgi:hypothetical protein
MLCLGSGLEQNVKFHRKTEIPRNHFIRSGPRSLGIQIWGFPQRLPDLTPFIAATALQLSLWISC